MTMDNKGLVIVPYAKSRPASLHICWPVLWLLAEMYHRENGGTLGMVPLIINPIYTLYSGYLDVFIG